MLIRFIQYTLLNKRVFGVRKCIWVKQCRTKRDTAKRPWIFWGVLRVGPGRIARIFEAQPGIVVFTVFLFLL